MSGEIMVSVIMIAYNHEKYISKAIDSVLKQKMNFNIEILIHDDASTDRTPMIIKEYEEKYPEIIKAEYEKENQGSKNHVQAIQATKRFFGQQMNGKYFALCECDDYWIDENKLQKQIDFLEAHQEYSMCMSNALMLNDTTGEMITLNTFPMEGTYSQEEQVKAGLGSNYPAMNSFVFRTKLLKDMPEFFYESGIMDWPLRQYYAEQGSVYYFGEPMTVYRTAVPHSYTSRLKDNTIFYNNYTVYLIKFFEKFNDYTGRRFDHILENKIISDYLGFCSSIEKKEGLVKASEQGLDMDKVGACYDCLSVNHVKSCVSNLDDATDHLFIYGTSRLGLICKKQLEEVGIEFEGFVVSNGQMKPEEVEGRKVFYLSEVIEQYVHPGFLLAVQPINEEAILGIVKEYDVRNYTNPYALRNYRH